MMSQPLAERLRPKTLDDYIGQKHLVGQGAVLRKMIDAGRVPSFILWGPPGVGKTTLAQIIANKLDAPFYTFINPLREFLKQYTFEDQHRQRKIEFQFPYLFNIQVQAKIPENYEVILDNKFR